MIDPALYLIPVPLSDATRPAEVLPQPILEIVGQLRYFAVENIRSARRFIKSVDHGADISVMQFDVLDEHTDPADVPAMLEPLRQGMPMGVISEAGCPGVADPGALLVEAARRENLDVRPLVGPSSILLGLMASGFNGQNFAFSGYLPIEPQARKRRLRQITERIRNERQTQIFIETPYRNNRLIAELAATLPGEFSLCVACELTAPSQEVRLMTLSKWRNASYDFSKRPAIFLLS